MDNAPSEKPLLNLIQQVKDGQVDPTNFDKELRQQLVELCMAEGYAAPTIAQILKVSDKTIRRDFKDIHLKNALSPDPELAKKIVGELVTNSRVHRDHLMRMARISGASVSERAQAEYYASQVWFNLVGKLQSLGYLPSQPQAIVGDIFHHLDENQSSKALSGLKEQVLDVEGSFKDAGFPPEVIVQELAKVKSEILNIEERKNDQPQ